MLSFNAIQAFLYTLETLLHVTGTLRTSLFK